MYTSTSIPEIVTLAVATAGTDVTVVVGAACELITPVRITLDGNDLPRTAIYAPADALN